LLLGEIQENSNITYRLYDWGRPREMHIEQGMAVLNTEPPGFSVSKPLSVKVGDSTVRYLLACPYFVYQELSVSVELCGGTHVRNTSEIGLFQIASETGVAAGVRRVEALTGPRGYAVTRERQNTLSDIAELLRASPAAVVKRLHAILDENRTLERRLDEALRSGGSNSVQPLLDSATEIKGVRVIASTVTAADMKSLQAVGDALREKMESGVAVLASSFEDGRSSLLCVVTDDLRSRGLRADTIIRDVAAVAGGRGGGKPHMSQAGIPDASRIPEALAAVAGILRAQLSS
ncbi:MAG: DHHA1 domain-containing protein, partial [Gemmatimonadaceae bacterium]